MKNIYKDCYNLPFSKIYFSKMVDLYIGKDGLYKCVCCDKHPIKCSDKESAKEYQKIQDFMDAEDRLFGTDVDYPIKETGYIRIDQHNRSTCRAVWKIQRELAKKAGFDLLRSPFM